MPDVDYMIRRFESELREYKRRLASEQAAREKAAASLVALEREAERLRHGVPIEGDFVCPADLALTNAIKFLRDLSCDGCEYGDNCPPFGGTRHGECRSCQCRREADRLESARVGAP